MNRKFIVMAAVLLVGAGLRPVGAQSISTLTPAANQPPQLTANNPMVLDQGSNAVVSADLLAATDAESPPSQVTFTIGEAIVRIGQLRLNGTALGAGGKFTQADIDQRRLVYYHDDSTNTSDDFTFTVSDPNGNVIPGPPYYTYSFKIYINLVNHAPVAAQGTGSTGYGMPFHGTLPATDRDGPGETLHYRILTNGVKGTAVLTDTNTGAFVYTPNAGERGADIIHFQVNDGEYDSVEPGTFTITLRPLAVGQSYAVVESAAYSGMLEGTNALPPHGLTYQIVTNAALGTVVVTDTNTGAFTYAPAPGMVGPDAFSFVVNDGFIDSEPASCTISIRPVIEPGDLFVTVASGGVLVYVDRQSRAASVVAAGDHLYGPKACTLDRDGTVVVLDGGSGVVRVDPITGTQTIVSSATNFSSGNLSLLSVAVEADGTILVADGPNGVVRVAPDTGAVTPLATGGNLVLPLGVTVAGNGEIFVADAATVADTNQLSRVVRIDPVSGGQTVISAGTNLVLPVGIALESPDTLLVGDAGAFVGGRDRVLRIDVTTGAQSIVSEGGNLAVPVGFGIDDLGTIVVVSQGRSEVLEIDPLTGSQEVIASGPGTAMLLGLAVARGDVLPDSDGDGLPDWWEQRCFPYADAEAGGDPDQDGLDNEGEFKAGTSPTDPQSALKLAVRPAPEGGVILEWSSAANRIYTLERSPVLSHDPALFTPFRTGIKATPPINTLLDAEAGAGGNYFYRLRLEE